jgi:hypothetical protein
MPDNTRTLYKTDPPSGAADALFGVMKQNMDLEQYAKKKDIDTGAAQKLNEQENTFRTGLAHLNQKFQLQKISEERAYAESEVLKTGAALNAVTQSQALASSNATGKGVLGLTKSLPPDPSGYDTPQDRRFAPVGEMDPRGASLYTGMLGRHLTEIFNERERASKQSFDTEKDALNKALGLTTVAQQSAAQTLVKLLRASDPNDARIPIVEIYAQPGSQSNDFERDVMKVANEFEDTKKRISLLNTQGQQRMAQMREHDANIQNLAKLKAKLAESKDGAGSSKAITDLRKGQSSLKATLSSFEFEISNITNNFNAMVYKNETERAAARTLQQKYKDDAADLRDKITEIDTAIAVHNQKNMPPSDKDKRDTAESKRELGARILKEMGIKDPSKMSDKQKTEFMEKVKEAGG